MGADYLGLQNAGAEFNTSAHFLAKSGADYLGADYLPGGAEYLGTAVPDT